jgi:peptidoglycan-associated lipoprotein
MVRSGFRVIILIFLCLGLTIVLGCPKKSLLKEDPSVIGRDETASAATAAEREKTARREAEQAAKDKADRDARAREEAARKAEAEQSGKDLGLVAKKYPGIEGEILESKYLKDVYFEFDRYEIRPEDASTLKETAAILGKNPRMKVQVEGHTDERGTIEYNLALGERRANSVRNYLISLGVPKDRISTISYGKERPLDAGHTEEAWAKNRRAHIVVTSR